MGISVLVENWFPVLVGLPAYQCCPSALALVLQSAGFSWRVRGEDGDALWSVVIAQKDQVETTTVCC